MLVNAQQLALQKHASPGGGVCQFPWCKCSHHGQFQTAIVMSLNMELERDVQNRLSQVCASSCDTLVGPRAMYGPETLLQIPPQLLQAPPAWRTRGLCSSAWCLWGRVVLGPSVREA